MCLLLGVRLWLTELTEWFRLIDNVCTLLGCEDAIQHTPIEVRVERGERERERRLGVVFELQTVQSRQRFGLNEVRHSNCPAASGTCNGDADLRGN